VDGCLACDLAEGRVPLPGGVIHESTHWFVEHCVGPLGVGTLLLKPKRHVIRVSDLTNAEAGELGPLLQRSAAVVDELVQPEQVYTCLWSHAGGTPVHIHYVVQPATRELMDAYGVYGPNLQVAMFDGDIALPEADWRHLPNGLARPFEPKRRAASRARLDPAPAAGAPALRQVDA
jgi:diadenosine tetraphosphate (Ap4A) HIT family hydrolase